MSPLLGPILAQIVTLGISDRTEVRSIVTEPERYSAGATSPRVTLDFGWKHTTLSLGYGPSITLVPLGEHPSVLVFHTGAAALSHRWARTTLTLSEAASFGRIDLRTQALADPRTGPVAGAPNTIAGGTPPPAMSGGIIGTGTQPGTTTTGGTTALQAIDQPLTFASWVSALNATQLVSASLTVSGGVSYSFSGASGADRALYPTVTGPGAQLLATYRPTRADAISTSLSTQATTSSIHVHAWLLTANESWTHRLTRDTTSSLGSGLSITRNSLGDGTVYYSIFPNFLVGISTGESLGRTRLSVAGSVSSAPYIDPVSAVVDPRISTGGSASLSTDKFSCSLAVTSGLALATGEGKRGLNSVNGTFTVGYRLGAAVSVDSGLRLAWQDYQGAAGTLPVSVAVFAGITVGLAAPLTSKR